jgi:chromosome segregation ATPase
VTPTAPVGKRAPSSPSISHGKPSDAPPRLAAEVVRSARPLSIGSMPRISTLEQELAKERSERAAEADTMAEMLVRLTTLESRAKTAETALAAGERDAEAKVRAAKEQGAGLARKIEDAEGRIAELESELRTARARNADLEKKAKKASADEDLEQRLLAAQGAAEKSSDRARASEERNLELLDRVSSLQAELTSVQQVAADVQTRLAELARKHEELETSAQEKIAAGHELGAQLEKSVASEQEKVAHLIADRARVAEEQDELIVRHDALQKEHASLGTKLAGLEKELATTREHYEKALADARRTETSRVAALEAKNEDTRNVLERKIDETKKSLAAEQKSHAELRAVLEAVQTEAAATSAKLTEVSQERDRVSVAMTSLAERVSTLETRETAMFAQLGAATTALQRANAAVEAIESSEYEHAQRRAHELADLREALHTPLSGTPGRRTMAAKRPLSDAPIVDITDEAELLSSIAPPKDSSAPPSSEGWDQPAGDDDDGGDSKT